MSTTTQSSTSTPPGKPAAKPVPDGMHTVTPHLVCDGAAAAIGFYQKAFGATELMRVPGPDGKLIHAAVKIGDSIVMLVDAFPEWGSHDPKALKGSPVTIHLAVPNVDEVFARAVAAGCKVMMPLDDMFWGDRYGSVVDPFGHNWSMATHIRELTPEEIMKAMPTGGPCPES
jgi:PhnB protein